MCSLFGWLDYQGIVPYRIKKKLTQALANAAEERGTDAAGISYVHGKDVVIFKRPKPAHKLHFSIPEGTAAVMGHTRMTTQGDGKHNYNNHPFPGLAGETSFAFAHNGVLWNDKELRKENIIPDTHIETDSYAACQLIEAQQKLDFKSLRYMAKTVEGNFTFSILDEHNSLYIIKGSNPMCLLHFPVLGLYIYASTESIMKKALQRSVFTSSLWNGLKQTRAIYYASIVPVILHVLSLSQRYTVQNMEAGMIMTTLPIITCTKKYFSPTAAAMALAARMLSSFWSTATPAMKLRRCLWIRTCSMRLFVT